MQAAYHGVPIVGIPMVADQPDNIVKAVARGFGIMFHRGRQGINAEELHSALLQILTEPRFKQAAAKISVRMRARKRTPLQEAAGDTHLHCDESHASFVSKRGLSPACRVERCVCTLM